MSGIYEAGDLCVYCGKDTGWGSGRFINRVAAQIYAEDSALAEDAAMVGAEMVDGFSCAECMEMPCDKCGEPIALDEDHKVNGAVYHYQCISREDYAQSLLDEGYEVDDSEFRVMMEDYDTDHATAEVK